MRALTKPDAERKPSDLYRTPQALLDAWLTDGPGGYLGYRPHGWREGTKEQRGGYLIYDPMAGDGRWGRSVARECGGLDVRLSDINPDTQNKVWEGDALEWERPIFRGSVVVTTNPAFSLLDCSTRDVVVGFVDRVWSQLKDGDELVFLTTTVSHANMSRPVLYRRLKIMPYESIWSIRWRSPMEDADGVGLGGAAVDYQIVRAIKGLMIRPGETRQWDVLLPEQWERVLEKEPEF